MSLFVVTFVAAQAFALPPPPRLPQRRTVAVLPLEAVDVPGNLIADIETQIIREIEETDGLHPVGPNEVIGATVAVGLEAECDGDVICVARAGRYSGGWFALETRLAFLGGVVSISMRFVDARKGAELRRAADTLSDERQERSVQIHEMLVRLLTPKRFVGTLVIDCPQVDAEVYLDDRLVGTTPLKDPLTRLNGGTHILRVTKAGFTDLYRFVDVRYGQSTTVSVDLETNDIATRSVQTDLGTGYGSIWVVSEVASVEVRIDSAPKGTTPLAEELGDVPAGERRLSLRAEGVAPFTATIEVVPGRRADVAVVMGNDGLEVTTLEDVDPATQLPTTAEILLSAAPLQAPAEDDDPAAFYTGIGLLVTGAVAIVASIVLGQVVEANQAELEDATTQLGQLGAYELAARAELIERMQALNSQTPGLLGAQHATSVAGAAFVLVGGTLLIWDIFDVWDGRTAGPGGSASAGVEVGFTPTPDGGRVMIGGSF